jgi:hypothetical protein
MWQNRWLTARFSCHGGSSVGSIVRIVRAERLEGID